LQGEEKGIVVRERKEDKTGPGPGRSTYKRSTFSTAPGHHPNHFFPFSPRLERL
jgi:hypothetical protein